VNEYKIEKMLLFANEKKLPLDLPVLGRLTA
jgi:hypothetical protein